MKHSSPNSAQTESACAGALKVSLSGDNYYFGRLVHKPQIGDSIRELEIEDIKSNILLYITAFIMIIIVLIIRSAVMCYFC
ncbi:MAG: cobalamin biosynthesis protein [Lachnospira eligens]